MFHTGSYTIIYKKVCNINIIDIMKIYLVPTPDYKQKLAYLSKGLSIPVTKLKNLNLSTLSKNDLLISNDYELSLKAKRKGITTIFLMKRLTYPKSSEPYFDFSFWYETTDFKKSSLESIKLVIAYKKGELKPKTRNGVANIILNKKHDKILVLKNRHPGWGYGIVQGGIEEGENDLEALKRETYEESGITVFNILGSFNTENKPYHIIRFGGFTAQNVYIMRYKLFVTEAEETNKITFNDRTAKKSFVYGRWVDVKTAYKMLNNERHWKYLDYASPFLKKMML